MKQNISSQFNYTVDLGLDAMRAVFKLRKTKKDIIMNVLLLVFIGIFAAMVVFNIVKDNSFVLDLIILIFLIAMEVFSLIMPLIIVHNQKRFLKELKIEEMDYTTTEISKEKCIETYYKDNKVSMQNVCNMNKLMAYKQQDNYIFAVFSNFACAIFDTNTLTIDKDELIRLFDTTIQRNKSNKTLKR